MPQSIRAKRDLLKEKNYQINFFILFLVLSFFSIIFVYLASINLLFALGFAALGAVALIFYQKPEVGIFLIVLSILGGQLLRLNIGSEESGLLVSDILIPFFIFIWLLRVFIKKDKIPSSFIGPFLFVFIFIAIISMVNGLRFLEQKQAIVSVFYLIRLINYALLFFASASIFFQNEGGIKRFKAVLILTFVLFAVAGIFQVIFFPDLAAWTVKYGWDPHVG
ncbi:MAG: hypothetical protein NTW06_03800, partial [Candidatus Falkowbacteria bacterium]|nr:hypothetical protein [Candidatus Falkowbacteria bacterium]